MTFASPFSDVLIPDVSVYEYLFGSLRPDELDHEAVVDGITDEVTTYRTLVEQVQGIAGALSARGVGVGDVVALHLPNLPVFVSIFHGILRSGATATTINVLNTSDDICSQIEDSGATLVFTMSALLAPAMAGAAAAGLGADQVIVVDGSADHTSLNDLLAMRAPAPVVAIDPATHLAVLPYSSGTTARPKGVMLTHRNLVANVAQSAPLIGVVQSDRLLAVLPFFHIYGMTVLLNLAVFRRATLVTMPKFELANFLRIVQDNSCTYVFIAPPIALALAKHPLIDSYNLSSVHTVFSGAAPLDGGIAKSLADRLDCRVRQGYGMTEMSPVSHVIPLEDDHAPLSSVGVTLPNIQCKLVDPMTGQEIDRPSFGVSEPGELLCKGPNIMLGYLGNSEATAETFDSDGFLRTGDIATLSSEGYVTVVDRLKELIKYKGYQVAPAELEAMLVSHPLIADAAVVAGYDVDGEEVPKAFVVIQTGAQLSELAIMKFVAERVAPHKKIRQITIIDSIPKSSSGKILRKDLRMLRGNPIET
ncbi:AMP-binding protein [Cryobacterium sp. N21]|uniref:AMP-binding protein n=1 Tax=Cryobacterium sp. N21 TaxID=2048289 RepID=UPI000CE2D191|nr:AMP-binding protein [Cryobacterium sp. N21]